MALKREMLKGMGLTEEQITAIIDGHTETVDGLKAQITDLREKAGAAEGLRRELDGIKGGKDWKAEHDKLKQDFEAYKADTEAKETATKVRAAYRELLKANNVDERRYDAILRATDLKGMKLNGEGKLEDADRLTEAIKNDWSDFIVTTSTQTYTPKTPPRGEDTRPTRDEIMAIKDTAQRQKAISENPDLFGI